MEARRILVAGPSGAGKTTLAAEIGRILGIPYTEIDALHWAAGWTSDPRFLDRVAALVAGPEWVTEFQYREAKPLLAARAELVVHLHPPRPVVLVRVVRRTLRRHVRREVLWGTNVEPPLRTVFTDPEHVVRWSMATYRSTAEQVRAALEANPTVRVVRLRHRHEVRAFLRALERGDVRR